jgi:hypothetical protein
VLDVRVDHDPQRRVLQVRQLWKHVWLRLNGDWGLGVGDGHVIGRD